jgi:hypothetical protein
LSTEGVIVVANTDHAFSRIMRDAAFGSYPPHDRTAEIVGALPGPCDAVAFMPGHTVVAADVDQDWLYDKLKYQQNRESNDPSTGLGLFLAAMADRLGNPPMYASVLTVAPHRAAMRRGQLTEQGGAHRGWADYRTDVRSYRYTAGTTQGNVDMGIGPGGRWDVYVRVDSSQQGGGGPSRELLSTALTMVPAGEQLFGSAPVHDTRALRTMLSGGFTPICTEVLFLTRPQG